MITATSNGLTTTLSEELPAGYYYTYPKMMDFDEMPGIEIAVTYSGDEEGDAPRREKLIPVESHKFNKPGVTHAVGIISCPHVGLQSGLSCSEGCKGNQVNHVGHWE